MACSTRLSHSLWQPDGAHRAWTRLRKGLRAPRTPPADPMAASPSARCALHRVEALEPRAQRRLRLQRRRRLRAAEMLAPRRSRQRDDRASRPRPWSATKRRRRSRTASRRWRRWTPSCTVGLARATPRSRAGRVGTMTSGARVPAAAIGRASSTVRRDRAPLVERPTSTSCEHARRRSSGRTRVRFSQLLGERVGQGQPVRRQLLKAALVDRRA